MIGSLTTIHIKKSIEKVKRKEIHDPVLNFQMSNDFHPSKILKGYLQWGMQGGNNLKTFDTDCGKIGILICYDSEFPELSRLLADDGMDILFVPFLTDTQHGYSRVRHCSHARAIENECYVAIAGSVGNLPNVHNMDIQYA